MAEMFRQIGIQKVAGIGLLAGSLVENLTFLELGTVIAMILYAEYSVLEGALQRRKIAWDFVIKAAELRSDSPADSSKPRVNQASESTGDRRK